MATFNKSSDGFKSGSGCFKCASCGKATRLTKGSEQYTKVCNLCYETAGWSNELSDNGWANSPLQTQFGDVFEVFGKCETLKDASALYETLRGLQSGYAKLNDSAHGPLLHQINYQINAIDDMHSGTGSTNLDVINEFHEVTGMITALRLIDVHADGFHLRRDASLTRTLQFAKNHALTNVRNINALRVVS